MRIVWSMAWAQLRHHRGRWALLAAGIALVVAVPVLTSAISASVSAQTVRRTIASFDVTDRTLLVSQEGDSTFITSTPAQNDRDVRAQLARLGDTPPLHELLFRPLTVHGSHFLLGGVDELAHATRLVRGRLPTRCLPRHCEVTVVGRGDTPALRTALASLGAVVVGDTVRADPLLVSGELDAHGVPLVLGADATATGRLASLALFGRHSAWVAPVDADEVVALGTARYVARAADVDAALAAKVGGTTFVRPTQQLQVAQSRADVSAGRFRLLGGFAAVLLVGFAVVAAIGLRRENQVLARALSRRGATPAQVLGVVVVEVVVATVVAALLGVLLGGAVGAAVSDGTGHGSVRIAASAAGHATGAAGVLLVATALAAALVLVWAEIRAGAVWRGLDLLALAALGAVLLAADRGSADGADLASSGDPLVVAMPVLASVIAGVVAARLWAPAAGVVERLLPRRSVAGRIGMLGAVRRPLRPAATVAFLTAAVASVVFAGAYRTTLLANDADQAAYQVPLDATVAPDDATLVPYVAPDAFGRDGRVFPVLRTAAGVTRLAGVVDSVPVVGVDAAALRLVHRWRRTTGTDLAAATVARKLTTTAPATAALPAGLRALSFPATGLNPNTAVTAWVRGGDGREYTVSLAGHAGRLSGALPRGGAPLRLVAVGIDETFDYATHHNHAVGEGTADHSLLTGTLTLGRPDGVGAWTWAGWGSLQGTAVPSRAALRLTYRLTGDPVVAAANFAAARAATLPVVTDAATAADVRGGVLALRFDATTTLTARVVATMPRLPTVTGPFVLVDRAALQAAFALHEPGRNAAEFWVAAPADALTHASVTGTLTRRDDVQAGLEDDPIGRGARTLLLIVALLALAVAALALVLLVGERRDAAGELFAWEADGTRPATLRAALAVRLVAVALVGIPVGVVAGLVVARVGTTLVAVDASGALPTPPLEVTLGSVWTPLALAIGVGAGLVLGLVVTARSLRERYPVAADVDLR